MLSFLCKNLVEILMKLHKILLKGLGYFHTVILNLHVGKKGDNALWDLTYTRGQFRERQNNQTLILPLLILTI